MADDSPYLAVVKDNTEQPNGRPSAHTVGGAAMLHPKRTFHVRPTYSVSALALLLVEQTWTLCTGFELFVPRYRSLLFLNDSTSEDGAQEYAVFHHRRQLESLTSGWCTPEKAERHILELLAGPEEDMGSFRLRIDRSHDHVCDLCR